MLQIKIEKGGKKFLRNWIFRNLSIELKSPEKVVILGPNGSGKSTLLQALSGQLSLSEGSIEFTMNHSADIVPPELIFRHVAIATPYLELIEEFTLEEIVSFHFRFKRAVNNLSFREIISLTQLDKSKDKVFKYFSSGMKQRVKLCLAILSDVDYVLLDEPLTNLDKEGMNWYKKLAEEFLKQRLVIVCSNHDENEYSFCKKEINISDYKS